MAEHISRRKSRHLEVCLDDDLPVESGRTGFSELDFFHSSLPIANYTDIDLSTSFLGYELRLPLMISCMTGGSDEGRTLNRILAQSAAEKGIAFGLGSIRIMLEHPERRDDFFMRRLAPDIPILANIGASELENYRPSILNDAVKSIEADALYVHLNAAQELFQERGCRDFRNWKSSLFRLLNEADFPILVKETGAGIPPSDGVEILEHGAAFIDIAGSGGTDWVAVESLHRNENSQDSSFYGWGYPSAALLLAYRDISHRNDAQGKLVRDKVIASGGIRTVKEYSLCLAASAWLAASALPFIRSAARGGHSAVHDYIDNIEQGIRRAIVLSGAADLTEFRCSRLKVSRKLSFNAKALVDEFDIRNISR